MLFRQKPKASYFVRDAAATSYGMQRTANKKKKGGVISIFSILIILVLLGGAIFFWKAKNSVEITDVVSGEYQAVFLDNGQTYFGKVSNKESIYVKLTEVYYLQFQQPLQDQGKDLKQSDLTLVKLGSELHGPEDEMEILRDHILFIENLADNSKVVQAIMEYKNNEL